MKHMKHYQIRRREKCMTNLGLMDHKVLAELEDLLEVKEDTILIMVQVLIVLVTLEI